MRDRLIFTSDSVTAGHPDKLCDRISDAIVDAYLTQDPFARINAECVAAKGVLFIAMRFNAAVSVDVASVARGVIEEAGYTGGGFDAQNCSIMTSFTEVPRLETRGDERGMSEKEIAAVPARQQVTLFGFACDQTGTHMPLPVWLAHRLTRRLDAAREEGALPYLAPDGQSQVAVEYRDGKAVRLFGLTVNTATRANGAEDLERLREELTRAVIEPAFDGAAPAPDGQTRLLVNPGGRIVEGGPSLHAGLTGRKSAIDTYGEFSRNSSSALSGKDPGRIDRIGAYAARYAARNIVAAGLARQCEVVLSYAIGLAEPVSVEVETSGTGQLGDEGIAARLQEVMDFRPAAIIARFGLRHLPQERGGAFYRGLAAYGHMGRDDLAAPWERTDLADRLS